MSGSFLQSLKDPKLRLLGPNIWFLKKIGMLLPRNIFFKAIYFSLPQIISLFLITEFMDVYLLRSNKDDLIENFKISMLAIVNVMKAQTYLLWQNKWKQVFEYVTETDEYEREHQDECKKKIIDNYTKYSRLVSYLYIFLLVFTVFVLIGASAVKLFSKDLRERLRNGTETFPHIFTSWMPFDKNRPPGCHITVFWHSYIISYGSSVIASYDSAVVVIISFFGGQFDIIKLRAREISGAGGKGLNDKEAEKMVRKLHQDYLRLTKYLKLFNSLLSPVMFLYVVVCSVALCASAYQLTAATTTAKKLTTAIYFVFLTVQLFMICWHGNLVIVKSDDLMFGLYDSQWWASSLKQRKNILLLMGQFRKNHILTAGPFTNISLSTFVTIMKGAYSYYTLLQK